MMAGPGSSMGGPKTWSDSECLLKVKASGLSLGLV